MSGDFKRDPFAALPRSASDPARRVFALAFNDGADLAEYPRSIRCNAAGNVSFIPYGNLDADVETWTVAAGDIIPVVVRRIRTTGTTVGAGTLRGLV